MEDEPKVEVEQEQDQVVAFETLIVKEYLKQMELYLLVLVDLLCLLRLMVDLCL